MCKRIRFKKKMLMRNVALLTMLCLVIGAVYIPVFAEEEDESGFFNSENKDEDSEKQSDLEQSGNDLEENGEAQEKLQEENAGDDIVTEEEDLEKKDDYKETVSGNDINTKEFEEPEAEEKSDDKLEMLKIVDVLVPATYTLALNPYGLPIRIGEDEVTMEQVISGTYGIVNKSSTDQIVKVSLTVEDMNDGKLVFVDSAEEARAAGENIYAVYLAAVPAAEGEILIEGLPIGEDIAGEALQNVKMVGAPEQARTLYNGMNEIAFKLSGATYILEDAVEPETGVTEDDTINDEPQMILDGLASGGEGVTAYTFGGAMNPNAAWEKLSGGIKISVVYTYWTADGSEEVIEGTGALISLE